MCGITGIIHFNQQIDIYRDKIKQLNNAIAHRGPDAEGFYFDDNVALANRRLSIIDLSDKANQPMKSNDANLIIVFNGEIYNHEELRNELKWDYEFITKNSDTEVILYSYARWGIECLHKFVGMFSLALYDKQIGKVYLARDRLGKKPLYFCVVNKAVYFSSEIQSFFQANILRKELNEEAIYHYLTFLTIHAPFTFYKNIMKLESGHYLEVSRNKISKKKYWDVADYLNKKNNDSFDNVCQKTEFLLDKSMVYRNVSDVPICVALSGGIDSSLNLYYSSRINKNLFSVNLSYNQPSLYDESEAASRYCKELNVKFVGNKINRNDFENLISEYIFIQKDVPIGDPNTILIYLLSKISKQYGAKVLLVGEGGDEIGGYPVYLKLNNEFKKYKNVPRSISKRFKYLPSKFANKLDFFFNGNVISKRHIHGFTEYEKRKFWAGYKDYNSYEILSNLMGEIRDDLEDSFLRKISNIEYKLRLPELILSRLDYPSMASSIEARSPFMDHKLIEYLCSLSFKIKMKDRAKSVIKALAKEKLPNYVLNHPKVGFGMLLTPLFQNTMPSWFYNDLINNDNEVKNFIKPLFLESLYETHQKTKNNGYKMWIIYALNKWLKANKF